MTPEELHALIDRAADEGWKELDLSGHGLTELPPTIGKLTQLETLILGKVEKWEWVDRQLMPTLATNSLTTLPKELAALDNLQALDVSGNPLKVIPNVVLELQKLTALKLVSTGLSKIPEAIANLTNLTTLYLSANQISDIGAIANLTNLITLDLSNNQISDIAAIANLTNLTALSLGTNQISDIEAIANLTRLTRFFLYNNQISNISAISQLTNLTTLSLHTNQIIDITAIFPISKLTALYLSDNQISDIAVIANLTNLTLLSLFNNQISDIAAIANLTNLTILDLSNNQISDIDAIAQLTNLTELSLSNNQISDIDAIAYLTNLITLFLKNNQIRNITAITNLTNLITIDLHNNQISDIDAIATLTNLTQLSISTNQISDIAAIATLTNLTQLSLGTNQISDIAAIANLTNLAKLNLSANQISDIAAIDNLTNLTLLSLVDNQIKDIEPIAYLANLTTLYLGKNQITEIPDTLQQLTKLEVLGLRNNQIAVFPDWLTELPNIAELDLRGNPLPISPEALGPADPETEAGSVEGIFNYVRQLRSGKVRPLNEAKVILVGQGSVGKTSLIERLIDQRFDPHQPQTDGLSVRTWPVQVNSKDVRLNVWDFGGQEIYHATHQFFLTKRSLYLLVCSCRDSEDQNRLEYWLKLIDSFGEQSPVIIVGNKSDEQPLDINRRALRDKYPNIKAILETSCQTNSGLDQLREAIIHEVAALKEVYDLLPLSWFEVKESLEAMNKDFISNNEYIGICARENILDEQNQEQLITLLHNLGLVLSFRDHPILQNTNVLNPDWVTQGIYAILSDETLKTQSKGMLTTADLSRILDPERYPASRYHYLIELMKEDKFQLCFKLPDCPTSTFLIPGLLPKEEPENTALEGDTLEFQYHYRILPESIMSRFIVLTHDKIYRYIYWRSGVMLAYQEGDDTCNIARIKADPEDKKIFISISGRAATRRLFLGILRDVFNKIHNSFGNLEVSEWVPVPDYPDHPPLDYQELLGLEAMGEREYAIGKLRRKVNLRQLLDGYEPFEARQRKQMGDRDEPERIEYKIYGDFITGDKVGNDKVGNDKIGRDKRQNG